MIRKALRFLVVCGFLLEATLGFAQRNYDLHWVRFKDKTGTPHSLFHPEEFLTPRSIERRQRQGILIDSTDLPISPQYIAALQAEGYRIHLRSRWLNGVAVVAPEADLDKIRQLPFVQEVRSVGFVRKSQYPKTGVGVRDYKDAYAKHKNYYGNSLNQIAMLNGHYIHAMGFRGKDMHVAVMDGGFNYMPETPAFDSLFIKKQIQQTYDFLEGDAFVFESSEHGTDVLSTMAANQPYLMVGTAPDALYYLYKTEDELGEYVQEEYAWIMALEYADSIGVSVVNTSLGYYDFDDNNMDYAFVDMNGQYAPMSIAANIGASKGLLIVTSAGNEGDNPWKHITVPGDAQNVLTIGAVDRDGFHAKFSSMGFSDRPYIKPDLMARGHTAIVASRGRYDTRYQFGTSFSSPIMAGMVTSFWQAVPQATSKEIREALQRSGSQFSKPDTMLGYGVPDFLKAYKELSPTVLEIDAAKEQTSHYFHGANMARVDIFINNLPDGELTMETYDMMGVLVAKSEVKSYLNELTYCRIPLENQPAGVYIAYLKMGAVTHRVLIGK